MKRRHIPFLMIALLVSLHTGSFAGEISTYPSPDGKLTALVVPLPGAPYGAGEHRVEIRSPNGSPLFSHSYGSEGGEHGFGVEHAAWTPDSRFFVYSLSSSGGHQPWHFPTDFIEANTLSLHRLDEHTGLVTAPGFKVLPPDRVRTVGQRKADMQETTFEVRLSELLSERKPTLPNFTLPAPR